MKPKPLSLLLLAAGLFLLPGCISIPPLVQVEHKESINNADLSRRLDSIDHRLDKLEKKVDQQAEAKAR